MLIDNSCNPCAVGCGSDIHQGITLAYNLLCKIWLSRQGNWGESQWRFGACCFGMARAWWTSFQIVFSKNSSNHDEDMVFNRNCQRKYTALKTWGGTWDRDEICNQEILEGRQLQGASGRLIIEQIRKQCSPNNTPTNCFKSGLTGKWAHHARFQQFSWAGCSDADDIYYTEMITFSRCFLYTFK